MARRRDTETAPRGYSDDLSGNGIAGVRRIRARGGPAPPRHWTITDWPLRPRPCPVAKAKRLLLVESGGYSTRSRRLQGAAGSTGRPSRTLAVESKAETTPLGARMIWGPQK